MKKTKKTKTASIASNDEHELRAYIQQTVGSLRDDRSTCSYALEFLKTERANLLLVGNLKRIQMAADSYAYISNEVLKSTRALVVIADSNASLIAQIKKTQESTNGE